MASAAGEMHAAVARARIVPFKNRFFLRITVVSSVVMDAGRAGRPQDAARVAFLPSGRRIRLHAGMSQASLTDAQLVARCRAGEREAWHELVTRFSRYVYAICVQAFRLPEHDAEDVFQEVFARVYEHLERLRDEEAIRPWIGQLARRCCIDRLRP